MIMLPLNAADDEILRAVESCVVLISNQKFAEAHELMFHPEGDIWTLGLLREQIAFFAEQFDEPMKIPPADEAKPPEHFVQRPKPGAHLKAVSAGGRLIGSYEALVSAQHEIDPGFLGEVCYQMPFGATWSDVFATFVMLKHESHMVLWLKSMYVH